MRIDTQCHIFPKEYGDFFVKHSIFPKAWKRDGNFFFDFDGAQMLVMDENVYKTETLISSMDDAGIDLSLISCNIPDPGLLPLHYVQEGCRIANAAVLREVRSRPARFAGIAFLPWNMPEAALSELTWVCDNGFKGVMLFSHNGGTHTDDPSLEPVYARCEQLQMPIVLHPGIPLWYEHIGAWGMVASVSFVIDTGFALIRMIRSGVLEKYPGLKLVMPHAGGVMPYLDGRLGYTPPGGRGGEPPINKRSVIDTLKNGNIWYDLANPSEVVIAFALKYFTAEKLMFGSDYPFVEQKYLTELIEQAVASEAERDAVNWKNATKLFSLG